MSKPNEVQSRPSSPVGEYGANEAVERLRKYVLAHRGFGTYSEHDRDIDSVLADRESLLREAKAFRAMVEHGLTLTLSIDETAWRVWRGHTIFGEGATPLEAVEAAIKSLEANG
jgi:hypothetical protein